MKKKIFAIFCLIFLFTNIHSEDIKEKSNLLKHGIGYEMYYPGQEEVGGLTYQQWFNNDWGFQISLGLHYSYIINCFTELSVQRLLFSNAFFENGNVSFYWWGNIGAVASSLTPENFNPKEDFSIYFGSGVGIELMNKSHFSFPFKIGYSAQLSNQSSFGISFGFGLRYRY